MTAIAQESNLKLRCSIKSMDIRNAAAFSLVALYLLLNYGFMLIRIPPATAAAIPIGELALIIYLLKINYKVVMQRIGAVVPLIILIAWWGYGLGHAIYDGLNRGIWALRDATHVIESLFLIVGFCFAGRQAAMSYMSKWLPVLLASVVLYALGYPVREYLQSWSPKITAAAGYEAHLLFSYTNTAMMLIWCSAYILLFKRGWRYTIFAAAVLGYSIFLFQARTIYLQTLALFVLFVLFRRDVFGKLLVSVVAVLLALIVIGVSGIKIEGRLGQEVSLEFIVNHFLAIGGVEAEGVEGAAHGVDQRLAWWTSLFRKLSASLVTTLFGLGYGIPLTDFVSVTGAIVRELHNSYLSLLGRLGVFGFMLWMTFHATLLRVWWYGYRKSEKCGLVELSSLLLFFMSYFIMIWVLAIGEDAFEKPFNAIPYYFFWGIVLRWGYVMKFKISSNSIASITHGNYSIA